ncbi:hypothetical protein E6C60_0630 [Paenibacillus algicola]|uniref:Uncharacterized protein n=1 Tax=Paenibacillus algicola TaxID=2565926 RepID=A0A4P8XFZ9_9BACL|nr:hypothetical protein E6C60_0630 [Paenibacillus algicola]
MSPKTLRHFALLLSSLLFSKTSMFGQCKDKLAFILIKF